MAPALGRGFAPEDDRADAAPVVVLSHGLWQRRFGSDPGVIGATLTLDGQARTVVGVMPPGFAFPSRDRELWVPLAFTPDEAANRGGHYLTVVGRLEPGVTLAQARADVETIARRLEAEYPSSNARLGAIVIPLHEELVGEVRPALLVLLGAVGLVLLIACTNVANLLLARSAARRREVAIRAALGADRGRIVRQMLTESLLLSILGAGLGLGLSAAALRFLSVLVPDSLTRPGTVTTDVSVLLFTVAVALLTGVGFGMAPALQLSRLDVNQAVKEGVRGGIGSPSRRRTRSALVVSEVALSLILLVGAGLLVKSFQRLRTLDPGFRTENRLSMTMVLPRPKYDEALRRNAFYAALLARVGSLPGVQSAAVISHAPLTFDGDNWLFVVEGRPEPANQSEMPVAVYRVVSPGYFETVSIPLLAGRGFGDHDTGEAPPVVVVNRRAAETLWPGQDAIGKRIRFSSDPQDPWVTVVGVVADARQTQLTEDRQLEVYVPYTQSPAYAVPRELLVRTAGDPLGLAAAVRREVWAVDNDLPVSNVRRLEDVLAASVARPRFQTLLLALFASMALVLAAIGVYGVISYGVAQRTREIGVRMALGATRRDILKTVVGEGVRLAAAGIAAGLLGAFALSRLLSSLLFGVSPTDPVVFTAVPALLAGIALLAAFLPAHRGAKVDPMVALRYE